MEETTEVQLEEDRAAGRRLSEGEAAPEIRGYSLEYLLGKGTFGSVWAGTQDRTGLKVAVKILNQTTLGDQGSSFQNEVRRLRELVEHPHVVTLLDAELTHD